MEKTISEWLQHEPRKVRPPGYSFYPLTVEIITKKTKCLLPKTIIQGKNVLDLGCGIPYVELWCNENKAQYTGVEIQKKLVHIGQKLISSDSQLFHDSIEHYLDNADLDKFDVIVVSSSLQCVTNFQKYLDLLIQSKKILIFEFTNRFPTLDQKSLEISDTAPQHTDVVDESVFVFKSYPSLGYIRFYLESKGYTIKDEMYDMAKKILPEWFDKTKFLIHAFPDDKKNYIPTMQNKTWSFDKDVANIFEDHAKRHIPDYNFITKSIPRILSSHNINYNDPILDFGCATGTTLRTLRYAGFTNLHGIDVSKAMLEKCPLGLANLHVADGLSDKKFKVILANWTLQFNKNKEELVKGFSEKLLYDSMCVITEKTTETPRELYHKWKKDQGCSNFEIETKERSLQEIMHCVSPEWYVDLFDSVGFEVTEFNKKLGFYTWILIKKESKIK